MLVGSTSRLIFCALLLVAPLAAPTGDALRETLDEGEFRRTLSAADPYHILIIPHPVNHIVLVEFVFETPLPEDPGLGYVVLFDGEGLGPSHVVALWRLPGVEAGEVLAVQANNPWRHRVELHIDTMVFWDRAPEATAEYLVRVTYLPAPDLAVTDVRVHAAPLVDGVEAESPTQRLVEVDVANEGLATATEGTLSLAAHARNHREAQHLVSLTLDPLPPGETRTLRYTWDATGTLGNVTLRAVAAIRHDGQPGNNVVDRHAPVLLRGVDAGVRAGAVPDTACVGGAVCYEQYPQGEYRTQTDVTWTTPATTGEVGVRFQAFGEEGIDPEIWIDDEACFALPSGWTCA